MDLISFFSTSIYGNSVPPNLCSGGRQDEIQKVKVTVELVDVNY